MNNRKSYAYTKHLLFLIGSTILFTFLWFQSTAMMINVEEEFLPYLSESLIVDDPLKSNETSLGVSLDLKENKIYRDVFIDDKNESYTQTFRLKDYYQVKNKENNKTLKDLTFEFKTHSYFLLSLTIVYVVSLLTTFILIILKSQKIKKDKMGIY